MLYRKFRLLSILLLGIMTALIVGCDDASVESSNENGEQIVSRVTLSLEQMQTGDGEGLSFRASGMTIDGGADSADYLSPIITATTPFNFAIPQWTIDMPEGAEIEVAARTATTNGVWSRWQSVLPNPDMTPAHADASVEIDPRLMAGSIVNTSDAQTTHDRIQLSVVLKPNEAGEVPVLETLSVVFVNSTEGPTTQEILSNRDRNPKLLQTGDYPKPYVIPRSQWCVRSECNYTGVEYHPVSHLILHHTVSNNSTTDWAANVRAIWTYHTFTQGWGDIGYNYLIDPNGNIYEGHLGGDNVIGTHSRDANRGSMGVALLGTFSFEAPPQPMQDALAELMAWHADKLSIDMWNASRLPLLDWGNLHFTGHRDIYGATSCPGEEAHALIADVRARAANKIGFTPEYIYVDELDSSFTRSNANWYTGDYNCGFNSHAFFTFSTTDSAESTNVGTYRPNIPNSGLYEVDAFVPFCATGETDARYAPYTINHARGTSSVTGNQRANLGLWMPLGQYNFSAGTSNSIQLSDLNSNEAGTAIWFDGIRLRPLGLAAFNVSPGDDTWLTSRDVTFNWNVNQQTGIRSQKLQVALDAEFINIIVEQPVAVEATSITQPFSDDARDLFWRVVIEDVNGNTLTSGSSRFHIDSTPPSSSFVSAEKSCTGEYSLSWQGSDNLSGIAHYNITYKAAGDAAWTVLQSGTESTSTTFRPPNANADYSFKVIAVDGRGNVEPDKPNGDISGNNINSCNLAPPTVVRPNNAMWLANRVVTFNWSIPSVDVVTNYRLQVATDEGFTDLIVDKNVAKSSTNVSHLFSQDYERLYWRIVADSIIGTQLASGVGSFGVDATPPTSSVFDAEFTPSGKWLLQWDGSDSTSGIASYTVQQKAEGAAQWENILVNSTLNSAEFDPPDSGKSYIFRTIATDGAGNVEQNKPSGDFNSVESCASRSVVSNQTPTNDAWVTGSQITFIWNTGGIRCITNMRLEVATDTGFQNLVHAQNIENGQTSRTITLGSTFDELFWRIVQNNTAGETFASSVSRVRFDNDAPRSEVVEVRRLDGNLFLLRAEGADPSSGIDRFRFEYRAQGVLVWTTIGNAGERGIRFEAPDPNTVYWVRSRAIDRVGNIEPEDSAGDMNTNMGIEGIDLYFPLMFD